MSRTLAIALGYSPDSDLAPRVVASAAGDWAERILQLSAASGIPHERDERLAELLAPLECGEEIPEELYQIVAQVFIFLDHVAKRFDDETTF